MIIVVFKFFHLYFDPMYAYSWVMYCIIINIYMMIKFGHINPIIYVLSVYGILLWAWMYLYFWITYELISQTQRKWVRTLFWVDLITKIWCSSRKVRMVSYLIVLIYLVIFGVAMPSEAKTPAIMAMFVMSWIAMVIDLFLAIV